MKAISIVLAAAAVVSAMPLPAETHVKEKRKSKFQFTGVNESGAEFGNKNLPGLLNKDYTWPAKSAIDVWAPLLEFDSANDARR
jgi:endoglucanase